MKKLLTSLTLILFAGFSFAAFAQDDQVEANSEAATQESGGQESQAADLDELLELVRQGRFNETEEMRQREQEFIAARDRQQQLLNEARQTRENEERRSERLEATFQNNETEIAQLQQTLQDRLGSLSELFGVLQQVAGDTRGVLEGSLVSIQYPNRRQVLDNLIAKASRGTDLPSIEEIEGLWTILLQEMIETGKVVRFPQRVYSADGTTEEVDLVRVGDFNLVSEDKFFIYINGSDRVAELERQPASRFTNTAEDLYNASPNELVSFAVDPSRGQLLSVLVQAPSVRERIDQGGTVGYIILALGAIGMLFVIERIIFLSLQNSKVRAQIKSGTPNTNNPLGRVLTVYENNKGVDVETLELKLDEAILRETPKLERFLTLIKIISAVAPLFGLLGTVTGMIATFQAITLFGTGDPKLMADGISQALVTTVLGLVVAIPTLLFHSIVAGMSKNVVHVLEEQSAGIIAVHAEKEAAHGGSA